MIIHAPAISRRSSSRWTSGLGAILIAAATSVIYFFSGLTSCGARASVLSPCAPRGGYGLTSVARDCSAPKAHDSDGLACTVSLYPCIPSSFSFSFFAISSMPREGCLAAAEDRSSRSSRDEGEVIERGTSLLSVFG